MTILFELFRNSILGEVVWKLVPIICSKLQKGWKNFSGVSIGRDISGKVTKGRELNLETNKLKIKSSIVYSINYPCDLTEKPYLKVF